MATKVGRLGVLEIVEERAGSRSKPGKWVTARRAPERVKINELWILPAGVFSRPNLFFFFGNLKFLFFLLIFIEQILRFLIGDQHESTRRNFPR